MPTNQAIRVTKMVAQRNGGTHAVSHKLQTAPSLTSKTDDNQAQKGQYLPNTAH